MTTVEPQVDTSNKTTEQPLIAQQVSKEGNITSLSEQPTSTSTSVTNNDRTITIKITLPKESYVNQSDQGQNNADVSIAQLEESM